MGWGGGAGLVLKFLPLPLQGLPSLGKLNEVPVGDTEILSAHWLSGLTQVQSGPICRWWPWLSGCVCGSEGPGGVNPAGLSPRRTAMAPFGFSSGHASPTLSSHTEPQKLPASSYLPSKRQREPSLGSPSDTPHSRCFHPLAELPVFR